MKIRIELDESLTEDEVVIRSSSLGEQVRKIEQAVSEIVNAGQKFVFYKDDTEYYLPLDAICFSRRREMWSTLTRKTTCFW